MSNIRKTKISRYIYVPFFCGLSFALFNLLFSGSDFEQTIWNFVWFALFGFAILFYNDYKIGKLAPEADDEAYNVQQKRNIILFTGYERAFDLCLDSIDALKNAKSAHTDKARGVIGAKTGINWNSFGTAVNIKVLKLTEFSTEIEVICQPIMRTALVDYGESFKTAEKLQSFFNAKNDEINRKSLEAKASIPVEFYSKAENTKVEIQ